MSTKYTLSATYLDRNNVRVEATIAEVLGEYYGKTYETAEAAEDARENAEELAREYYPTTEVMVIAS